MADIDPASCLAIQDLTALYAAAWDDRDTDGFTGTFAADGVIEAPTWRAEGHAELAAMVERAKLRKFGSRHHVSNHRIRLLSADTAEADANFLVISTNGLDHSGRYRDALVRQDGYWLFARRRVTVDWQGASSLWPPMVADRQPMGDPV